jgi:hypothetical protein
MYNSFNLINKNRPTRKRKSWRKGRTAGRKKRKRIKREISNAKWIYETTNRCRTYSERRKEE